MKSKIKFLIFILIPMALSGCYDNNPSDYPEEYIIGKWEVYKYQYSYYDENNNYVTYSEYPMNEGYYESYTFKVNGDYYYLWEDEYDMELYKGIYAYRGDFLSLDNIMYSIYLHDYTMKLETTYQGFTTEITLQKIN